MTDDPIYTGEPAEEQNISLDQARLLQRMKAIASDLWGEAVPETHEDEEKERAATGRTGGTAVKTVEGKNELERLWKTADETIDWTDALAHDTPTDGLTASRLWKFYHQHAEKVLAGDLNAYTEVLTKANPLGELTDYAEGISIQVISADRLESCFICREEKIRKNRKLYLSALALRIARDLLACLPAEEVAVRGEENGKTVYEARYSRKVLLHRNIAFTDPVMLAEECGAVFPERTDGKE